MAFDVVHIVIRVMFAFGLNLPRVASGCAMLEIRSKDIQSFEVFFALRGFGFACLSHGRFSKQLEVLLLGALPFVECGEIEQEIRKSGWGHRT